MDLLKKSGFALPIVILIAVVLIAAGGVGYYFYLSRDEVLRDKTSQEQKEQVVDETAEWETYINDKLGFSIKVPKEIMHSYGSCRWVDSENSYRPAEAPVSVKVFEGKDNEVVYIASEYFYELAGETRKDYVSYFSECNKAFNSIELLELPKDGCEQSHYQHCWKIVAKDITSDKELEEFIKERYGSGCSLGEKVTTQQKGVYDIRIKGDGKDIEFTKCPMTYGVALKYYPEKNKVISWRFGIQAPTFYKDYNLGGEYDSEMIKSFSFLGIEDETADWKTYIDTTAVGFGIRGFELKYPLSWQVSTQKIGKLSTVYFKDTKSGNTEHNYVVLSIDFAPNDGGLTADEWWTEASKNPMGVNYFYRKIGTTSIGGLNAIKLKATEAVAGFPGPRYILTTQEKGGWIFDIDSKSIEENTVNEILSTFKFIEISEEAVLPNTPMMLDIDVSTTAGKPYTIGWKAVSEATNYILERDIISSFSNPISVYSGSSNSFSRTLSPSVSTRYYFRVRACNKYGCSSRSKTTELWVEVPPSITVTFPNRGENWVVGQTYKIEWRSSGLEKIIIDLFAYNSEGQVIKGFQHFIAKSIDATKGYYNWTIPEIADYPNYKLRIYNKLCTGGDELLAECKKTQYFDESDNYFSIISSIVWEALSACKKIRETSDIDLRQRCIAMVKKDSSGCEISRDPEIYCYKDVAMVTRDSAICEKIKDPGRQGACEALAERVPAKCSEWIYADYCYEEVAALTGDASICNSINYSGGRTNCKAVVLKDASYCENSDSEDCYQMLALLTGDEKVCEGLKERNDLERSRNLDREVNKCIKMAKREITGCSEVSGTGIDCDMIPAVAKKPSWCEKLEVNRDRCYFYTAMRIADLLPLELILLRN